MIVLAPWTPPIFKLPDGLLLVLAKHLDIRSLNSLTQTNHRLADVLNPALKNAAVLDGVNGQDALIVAARYGSFDLAKFALENGAKTTVVDTHGQTPLHWAAIVGQESVVRLLLDNGANPKILHSSSGDGVTPLYCAVKNGHYQAVDALISFQYGALVTSAGKDKNGGTILHWAAIHNPHIIQRLVQSARLYRDVGFDINVQDNNGEAPIHWAARAGQYRTVRALLGVGARVEAFNINGKTPLHVVFDGTAHEKTIETLLKGSAKINAEDQLKETPLHKAVKSTECSPSVVIYMVEHGARIDSVTRSGQTPLHLAAIRGDELICWYLIDNKVNMNAVDAQGKTALHNALENGTGFWRNPIVNLLLEKGASPNIKDKSGETVIGAAMRPDSNLEEWERRKMAEVYPQQAPPTPESAAAEYTYRPPDAFRDSLEFQETKEGATDRAKSWAVFEKEPSREERRKTQLNLESVKKLFHIPDGLKLSGDKPKRPRGSRYRLARTQ